MAKKPDDRKIREVSRTDVTKQIKETTAVGEVGEVKPAGGVSEVKGLSGVRARSATRTMTAAEREALFRMINEEAEKMFGGTGMSQEKQEAVTKAVKIAIDIGAEEEEKK